MTYRDLILEGHIVKAATDAKSYAYVIREARALPKLRLAFARVDFQRDAIREQAAYYEKMLAGVPTEPTVCACCGRNLVNVLQSANGPVGSECQGHEGRFPCRGRPA